MLIQNNGTFYFLGFANLSFEAFVNDVQIMSYNQAPFTSKIVRIFVSTTIITFAIMMIDNKFISHNILLTNKSTSIFAINQC